MKYWQMKRKKTKNNAIRGLLIGAIFFVVFLSAELVATIISEERANWKPEYKMESLEDAIESRHIEERTLSEAEYAFVFAQTGLARAAVDAMLEESMDAGSGVGAGADSDVGADADSGAKAFIKKLCDFQEDFFKSRYNSCEKIGFITYEERFRSSDRRSIVSFNLADIRDGDVLISNNTHSLGWRHGHAAIVIDAENGKTLESVLWGHPSKIQSIAKWKSYPRMAVLRISEEAAEELGYSQAELGKLSSEYAMENAVGIKYRLLSGFGEKAPEEMTSTQCAHLVWSIYEAFGADIDSDGGWLVTPNDIINSEQLEIVQVYGMNPKEPWV